MRRVGNLLAAAVLTTAVAATSGPVSAHAESEVEDMAAVKVCVMAVKAMDGAFGRLSGHLNSGGNAAEARTLLRGARIALADARDSCSGVPEMTADLQALGRELDEVAASL